MTLIRCVRESLFRPWDDGKRQVKEEGRLVTSPESWTSSETGYSPLPLLTPWVHRQQVPSMDQFLASLETSPESVHPHQLAALGLGPADIGELYQLAAFKSIHLPFSAGFASAAVASAAVASAAVASAAVKKQRPKRFRCPHCQVAFSNNGQLKGHVRSHTGNLHNYIIEFNWNHV